MTVSFLVVLMAWLKYEFKRDVQVYKHWKWVAAALLFQAAAGVVFAIYTTKEGNFFYHAVGGGVMTTLLFIYLQKTYRLHFNWRVDLVLLYAFVSALGILNELAEYAFELLGFGKLSFDAQDTWRDFVANTSGAIIAWGVCRLAVRINRRPAE